MADRAARRSGRPAGDVARPATAAVPSAAAAAARRGRAIPARRIYPVRCPIVVVDGDRRRRCHRLFRADPARHQPIGAIAAAAERHDPRRRRQPARDLRRSVRPAADLEGDVALSARGGHRDRGPPVLQPFRHRPDRAAARGAGRSRRRPRRRRRQHDHPATGQEPVSDTRAEPRAQNPRNPAGTVARTSVHQGRDPRNLSEPGLSRAPAPTASTPPRTAISGSRRRGSISTRAR